MPKKESFSRFINVSNLLKVAEIILPPIKEPCIWAYAEIRPKPKQSGRIGQGRFYKDPKVAIYEYTLQKEFLTNISNKHGLKLTGALGCDILCSFKSDEWAFSTTRPDVDNLIKPILDAIKDNIIGDDSCISRNHITKIKAPMDFVVLRLHKLPLLQELLKGIVW